MSLSLDADAMAEQQQQGQHDAPVLTAALVAGSVGDGAAVENARGGEALMEALDIAFPFDPEEESVHAPIEAVEAGAPAAEAGAGKEGKKPEQRGGGGGGAGGNLLLLGLSPARYMLRALRRVQAPELEAALTLLPFHYATRLLRVLLQVFHCVLRAACCLLILSVLVRSLPILRLLVFC